MNKADLIENGFYVALTGTDDEKRAIAIEVIDKAVDAGAKLRDGVVGVHHDSAEYTPDNWSYLGVKNGGTYFYDSYKDFNTTATKLTMQQFRDVFSDGWIEWHGGDCPVNPDDVVIATCSSGNEVQIKASELDWGNITRFMLYPEWPEQRTDAIGQNGNTGDHYADIPPHEYDPRDVAFKPTKSKYHREIAPGVWIDVYDVLQAWGVINPALQHLIKKALQPGERGHKTKAQDMQDIIDSAVRAKAIEPDA